MKRKTLLAAIALIAVFALALTGCGSKDAAEPTTMPGTAAAAPAQELGLASWTMSATTWSSPNGATVHLTAVPTFYAEGQSASFVVRLEGEEVASVPCQYDGANYTASAELNAADGLCYYVILTAADGATAEVAVNTPTAPVDDALIDMASSLQSYCNLTVINSQAEGRKLTLTEGTAQIQLPRITNEGEQIVCGTAVLVLTFDGAEVAASELVLPEPDSAGLCEASIAGTTFEIPELQDDEQLQLRLDVTLSNNQTLTAPGATFFYNDGALLPAVG